MPKPFKGNNRKKPEGELRGSQLVSTFGPGAMLDLVDQAVLVGGLDFWRYERSRNVEIHEPRLRDMLVERFRSQDRELSHHAFRAAPIADDDCKTPEVGVPVLEFPTWFVCQNPQCRALVRQRSLEVKQGRSWHRCEGGELSAAVPVRFLSACVRGHLDDLPWLWFVHEEQGASRCATPQLKLIEDATGDFSGISVRCQCGAAAAMSAAYHTGMHCSGKRPWLGGDDAKQDCEEHLRLLVRTASNSYFAQIVSALSIPEPGKELEEAIQEHWSVLKVATKETLPAFLTIPAIKDSLGRFASDAVLATITKLQRGTGAARLPLRTAEFKQLTSAEPESPGELPRRTDEFFARRCQMREPIKGIHGVVRAYKLREVRAQVGFTRFDPVSADLQGEFDLPVESARLGLAADWLPATEIRGEGIFLQLDEDAVKAWESRKDVGLRSDALHKGHDAARARNPGIGNFPGVRFYMLHSLSHLLITAISLECGYTASAIRERIYCGPSRSDPQPMAAILLSTGSSGSEGTLGGLVDQAGRIRQHLQRAFDLGHLCSNDPVCAGHSPADDLAERHLEGAACHGCLFISEPSCERYNRYLDRALVVPCLDRPRELAFFGERP